MTYGWISYSLQAQTVIVIIIISFKTRLAERNYDNRQMKLTEISE